MLNSTINKFGLCFINCEYSDLNLIKLLMHKIFLENNVMDTLSVSLYDGYNLGLPNFLRNNIVIVWLTDIVHCSQVYSVILSFSNKYSFYGIELAELNKDFELIELSSIFYLFNGEFYGILFNGLIFNPYVLTTLSSTYQNNFYIMVLTLQQCFINIYQSLSL